MAEEEGNGGNLVADEDLIAQYQTTRIRSLWKYKRIFQLTKKGVYTLDPHNFSVTNTFPYDSLLNITVDEKNTESFSFTADKTIFTYKCDHRGQLLCQLFECISKFYPTKLKTAGPFMANRIRKNKTSIDSKIMITSYSILEMDNHGDILQCYYWVNMTRLGADEQIGALFFEYSGRIKIFTTSDLGGIINSIKFQLFQIGLSHYPFILGQKIDDVLEARLQIYNSIPMSVSVFDVNKFTKRSLRPIPRQMHISEDYIVEMDSSGFQHVSHHRVDKVYALVRSWDNIREFAIEYTDGTSRKYTCTLRDTLLAMLLDVCHAAGNVKVIVTGEISDSLRLMPRFAEEEYQASIKDAFFGAGSIENWFLNRLGKLSKYQGKELEGVVQACRELNANVPCPGINTTTDINLVKQSMLTVVKTLQYELHRSMQDSRLDNSRNIATLLQSLFRLIPSIHGYKYFLEIKEIDTRKLLLILLKYKHDFVNYWTLEVIMALCRCPLSPRNTQQEFVNKHTILTDKMLKFLIDLMSNRIKSSGDSSITIKDVGESVLSPQKSRLQSRASSVSTPINNQQPKSELIQNSLNSLSIDTNASSNQAVLMSPVKFELASDNNNKEHNINSLEFETVHFSPNSLLVIGSAALLESLISSRRDTSSPELLNQILDLLAERCEVLIYMLRSTSFLIMENASILMFTLLKNRSHIASWLKELALSECLVLKHFYNAIYSSSGTQRFISRFLIAIWMNGSEKVNPSKTLLIRLIPHGLIEFLNLAPISEDQKAILDKIEDEYYNQAQGIVGKKEFESNNSNAMKLRMKKRITAVLKEQAIERIVSHGNTNNSAALGESNNISQNTQSLSERQGVQSTKQSTSSNKNLENYRVFFHAITQDHKLPDLIWNEQTRQELRSALETEIKDFENHQRLLGNTKIAWNYQHFHVNYPSISNEYEINHIYIKYFLESNDQFIRNLSSPSSFFEKLFRRILVHFDENINLCILCIKCFTKLYDISFDLIGPFDDMLMIVKLIQKAHNIELIQSLFDLLVVLTKEKENILQLLDRSVIAMLIQIVNLAHISSDQLSNLLGRSTVTPLLIKDSSSISIDLLGIDTAPLAKKSTAWITQDSHCPKTWYLASDTVSLPPKVKDQMGPYRISEILEMLLSGTIKLSYFAASLLLDDTQEIPFDQLVDTGLWKPISQYFHIYLQYLFQSSCATSNQNELPQLQNSNALLGSSLHTIYSPNQFAIKALEILTQLASLHVTSNSKQVLFYPIPFSKKLLSEPKYLHVYSLLYLTNHSVVVEDTSQLIMYLVDRHPTAMHKLYLTGLFYFIMRYTGNNFLPMAKLLSFTHLKQHFYDLNTILLMNKKQQQQQYMNASSPFEYEEISPEEEIQQSSIPLHKRSILGNLLPPAMIHILTHYGPEQFSRIFTSDSNTPEVIWNDTCRKYMIDMLDQHLNEFPWKFRQNPEVQYDYCPIPRITYPTLEKEIYVYEYYLSNLCDEQRFPNWPIAKPLLLLKETIERWKAEALQQETLFENSNSILQSIQEAKELLKLSLNAPVTLSELRKSYRNLVRLYHPDKNPTGREMFEQLQTAYELLTAQCSLSADSILPGSASPIGLNINHEDHMNQVISLLMRTQCILYRRYHDFVSNQKYPIYSLLLKMLYIPETNILESKSWESVGKFSEHTSSLRQVGVKLLYYTIFYSPLNVYELLEAHTINNVTTQPPESPIENNTLIDLSSFEEPKKPDIQISKSLEILFPIFQNSIDTLIYIFKHSPDSSAKDVNVSNSNNIYPSQRRFNLDQLGGGGAGQFHHDLVLYILKIFCCISDIEEGRKQLFYFGREIVFIIYEMLFYKTTYPLLIEWMLELLSKLSSSEEWQLLIVNGGLIWHLIPCLLDYDQTLPPKHRYISSPLSVSPEESMFPNPSLNAFDDENQRILFTQYSSNMHSLLAAKVLGRLGGYMFDDLQSPRQPTIQETLSVLLTNPLSILLRNRQPGELLQALNENVQQVTKIWNSDMRQELSSFLKSILISRPYKEINNNELLRAQSFSYSNLVQELCIQGVYVRLFVQSQGSAARDIENPSALCNGLLKFLQENHSNYLEKRDHIDQAVEALLLLIETKSYIAYDILQYPQGLPIILEMVNQSPDSLSFVCTLKALILLFAIPDVVSALFQLFGTQPGPILTFLKCLCTISHANVFAGWAALETLISQAEGHKLLLQSGLVVRLLACLLGIPNYVNTYQTRLAAMSALAKLVWHPVYGSDASAILRRFFPEPLIILLKNTAAKASGSSTLSQNQVTTNAPTLTVNPACSQLLQLLDTTCENPELIWTKDMQQELRDSIVEILQNTSWESPNVEFSPDYFVPYSQLMSEIYLGGVYIRVFLKQPTFRLTNTIYFLEKLIENWESAFIIQVPMNSNNKHNSHSSHDEKALILGKEDFLSLLTSCIICLLKNELNMTEHLLTWGFVAVLLDNIKRAIESKKFGVPLLSIIRIFMVLVSHVEVVNTFAQTRVDIITQLSRCLQINYPQSPILPKDSSLYVELLKQIFQNNFARSLHYLVQKAMDNDLPNFLLSNVLAANESSLIHISHPNVLRIHTVDLLKAMAAVPFEGQENNPVSLHKILELHPAWREYKNQSHDLFLTDKEKSDQYLIQDTSESRFAGLLTDGTVNQSVSKYFSSTGPLHKETKGSSQSKDSFQEKLNSRSANTQSSSHSSSDNQNSSTFSQSRGPLPTPPPNLPRGLSLTGAERHFTTTLLKGDHGIGLDLLEGKDGRAVVMKLKQMPPGITNPASQSVPQILSGDIIYAVNGDNCASFHSAVKAIRASPVGAISLTFVRP